MIPKQFTKEFMAYVEEMFGSSEQKLTGDITNGYRYGEPIRLTIKKVIFNNPATIILWSDKTKTVVKADDRECFDPEKGMAMAICKKVMGNKGNYYNEFKKWVDTSGK